MTTLKPRKSEETPKPTPKVKPKFKQSATNGSLKPKLKPELKPWTLPVLTVVPQLRPYLNPKPLWIAEYLHGRMNHPTYLTCKTARNIEMSWRAMSCSASPT